jgi:hypothetical protein
MATTLGSTGITFPDATTQTTAAVGGGMTLLGTLTTTSGTTQTLSGLSLTTYKELHCVIRQVSLTANTFLRVRDPSGQQLQVANAFLGGTVALNGILTINLANGVYSAVACAGNTTSVPQENATTSTGCNGVLTYSTASTSLVFVTEAGTFDFGSILVYGVK